jgi:hypothetical protein
MVPEGTHPLFVWDRVDSEVGSICAMDSGDLKALRARLCISVAWPFFANIAPTFFLFTEVSIRHHQGDE